MSDSNKHALYAVKETVFAATPATPSLTRIRNTSCSLALSKEGKESEETDPTRMVADYRHGNRQIGGDIGFEFSYGSFDLLLQGALASPDWTKKANVAASTISAAAGDSSFNDSANGFPLLDVGDIITTAGFVAGANNGQFKVVTSTVSKITVTNPDGTAAALITGAAGPAVTIISAAEILKAADQRLSYTFLRHFGDQLAGDKPFHRFTGCMVNTMSLSITPGGMITGSFGLLGKDLSIDNAVPLGATLGAPTITRVFDAFTGTLIEGGTALGFATEITLNVEQGLEAQFVLFSPTTIDPSMGKVRVSGNIGVHFRNSAMLEKFIQEQSTSLVFDLTDKAGNTYRFRIPRVTLNGGQPDTSSQGTIILSIPFVGLKDDVTQTSLIVERIPAA